MSAGNYAIAIVETKLFARAGPVRVKGRIIPHPAQGTWVAATDIRRAFAYPDFKEVAMRYPATLFRCVVVLSVAGVLSPATADPLSSGTQGRAKTALASERSRVIIRLKGNSSADALVPLVEELGGSARVSLALINAQAVELPHDAIGVLKKNPHVEWISPDRPVVGSLERTAATIGATAVRQNLGYDGTGIGVAIIDSGITSWHDDLAAPGGGQRVARFVDFVRNRKTAYDDYGHGTHVAGIIAGNGFDSSGARTGIAPGAQLTVLKVLDENGIGRISDVIAALEYAYNNRFAFNIRVVNLSVSSAVYESYTTDPLTLAAKRLVDAGIVVVAASGNQGRTPTGRDAYGGVTSPGNAPWVLTVGASSHMGTETRSDDAMAAFSSRGPTATDFAAKPDVVAPGVGIESLSNPDSQFYRLFSSYLLNGTVATTFKPYLSLSGTSMAAPVVTATVALMLQANPSLTPNAVKAILQYTAQANAAYDPLTAGAGFVDAASAVGLSRSFGNPKASLDMTTWSRRLLWGNQMIRGGLPMPDGNAWANGVTWGASRTPSGQLVDWGIRCSGNTCDSGGQNRWTVGCADSNCTTFTWGGLSLNVVWGLRCGGANCRDTWTVAAAADESVVWGTNDDESVVWGTSEDGSVVWGTTDDESVVWGTNCSTAVCKPVVWPR